VTGCNIIDNGGYAFFASSCGDPETVINAEDNWWGATDSAAIDAVIYHQADYGSSPTVDFVPFAMVPLCNCPLQCDLDEDSFITALDLGAEIDILFAGQATVQDPRCPVSRADFDCDGFSTALDLGSLIDHIFSSGPGPGDPCAAPPSTGFSYESTQSAGATEAPGTSVIVEDLRRCGP
jgi:hypothetical protein